jgi:hypothetical protein
MTKKHYCGSPWIVAQVLPLQSHQLQVQHPRCAGRSPWCTDGRAGGDGDRLSGVGSGRHSTAIAVLPGGTLNHFARDHGIPTDLDEALRVAEHGDVRPVDVGYLNDQLFLGTTGRAYVRFVQIRDRLERYLGY